MSRFPCPRCGVDQQAINVTSFNDREPRWVQGMECDCPGPRCPFCHTRIDERCANVECFMFGLLIPIPEMA